jgi:hypothetical protein
LRWKITNIEFPKDLFEKIKWFFTSVIYKNYASKFNS